MDELVITGDTIFGNCAFFRCRGIDYLLDQKRCMSVTIVLGVMARENWWGDNPPKRYDGRVFYAVKPQTNSEVKSDIARLKDWSAKNVAQIKAEGRRNADLRAGMIEMF